ncbi:glutaredoxin family protein [Microcella sp.]|uniref:glutaredoxin family protein n=1 Tax=Microcella sp. TaxID=1913979 RepID=UPI0039AFE541
MPPAAVPSITLTLIGKPGCHLCDDAREVVTTVLAGRDAVQFDERSILDDPELHDRYWDEIPVVLIDGDVHTIYRVDAERLQAALAERGH